MDPEDMIDMRTAEKLTGYSRESIRRWAKLGELELTRRGGKWFVSRTELQKNLEERHNVNKVTAIDDRIAAMIAAAPPLTPETRTRIAGLLGVSVRSDAA